MLFIIFSTYILLMLERYAANNDKLLKTCINKLIHYQGYV